MRIDERLLAKIQKHMLVAVIILMSSVVAISFFLNGVMIKTQNGDLSLETSSKNSFDTYDISYGINGNSAETANHPNSSDVPAESASDDEHPVSDSADDDGSDSGSGSGSMSSSGSGSVASVVILRGNNTSGVLGTTAATQATTAAVNNTTQSTTAAPVLPVTTMAPASIVTVPTTRAVTTAPRETTLPTVTTRPVVTTEPIPTESLHPSTGTRPTGSTAPSVSTAPTETAASSGTTHPSDSTAPSESAVTTTNSQPTDSTAPAEATTNVNPISEQSESTKGGSSVYEITVHVDRNETTDSQAFSNQDSDAAMDSNAQNISFIESPDANKEKNKEFNSDLNRYYTVSQNEESSIFTPIAIGVLVIFIIVGMIIALQSRKNSCKHMRRNKRF